MVSRYFCDLLLTKVEIKHDLIFDSSTNSIINKTLAAASGWTGSKKLKPFTHVSGVTAVAAGRAKVG
jgi:hypothetical protein